MWPGLHQKSGTALGTKFTSSHGCVYKNELGNEFLTTQGFQTLLWWPYIDHIFLFGLKKKKHLTHSWRIS